MEIHSPEVLKSGANEYGCEYLFVKDESGNRYILESFGMAEIPKEKILLGLIKDIEERINNVSGIAHPRFIVYLGVTRHRGRPYLVLPGSDVLWDALTDRRKKTVTCEKISAGLKTGLEIINSLHKDGFTATGLSCREILWQASDQNIIILDPEPAWILAPYRQEKNNFRLSPEYIKKMSWTFGSDVFAFGAAFYHWLTGRYPFFWGKADDVATNIMREKPLKIKYYLPEMGEKLSSIFLEMMVKEENERPETEKLLSKIANISREEIFASQTEKEKIARKSIKLISRYERGQRVKSFWRKHRVKFLGVFIILASILAIWVMQGPPPKPVVTEDTEPQEVMRLYFKALNTLDHHIMDQIATDEGAGDLTLQKKSNIRRSLQTLYVLNMMQKKVEMKANSPLQVKNFTLEKVSESPDRVVFKAYFTLRITWGKIQEEQEHEDIFTLAKRDGLWKIVERENNYTAKPISEE